MTWFNDLILWIHLVAKHIYSNATTHFMVSPRYAAMVSNVHFDYKSSVRPVSDL